MGWYKESTLTTPWNFETDTVGEDSLYLYAKRVCAGHVNEEPVDHKCDVCGQTLECIDENKDHVCDYGCNETIGTCEDTDHDHYCDYGYGTNGGCRQYFGTHADAEKDHVCDYGCSVSIGTCADTNTDHLCDYGCGKRFGGVCSGGSPATCKQQSVCDYCKKPYGDVDKTNHTGVKKWTIKSAAGHEQKWNCCGDVVVSLTEHTWAGGACSLCGYACLHPTTVTVGYKPDNHIKQWAGESGVTSCTVCGEVLRENTKIAPSAHRGGNEYASSDTEHWKTCTYYGCDAEVKNTREAHTLDDSGVCTTCGYKKTADYIRCDFDNNEVVDSDDAIYLLRHVFFGEQYPVGQSADLNKDGAVTSDDAIYLLRHVYFPETYPL